MENDTDDLNNTEFTEFELLQSLIQQGDAPSLKQQLLKSASGVECKDDTGNTPLLQAAYLGKSNCMQLLLEIGQANCKVINVHGQNALTLASYAGCIECIEILLAKWTYKDYTESSFLPPLCVAAMRGHLNVVNLFCQLTPSPNVIQSVHGITPLQLAEKNGYSDVVQRLSEEIGLDLTGQNGKQQRRRSSNRSRPY
ncbi:DNA replication inhibitor plutonium [Bradysia coprophila]|uniref:DNA replication inhibitor plutonium n=1 Tax=Bradysia coprophila TaxID=38358 RepID=UPI00187DBC24|nr:DNA replication inhibitor plutonium [Bradysia coprophila]